MQSKVLVVQHLIAPSAGYTQVLARVCAALQAVNIQPVLTRVNLDDVSIQETESDYDGLVFVSDGSPGYASVRTYLTRARTSPTKMLAIMLAPKNSATAPALATGMVSDDGETYRYDNATLYGGSNIVPVASAYQYNWDTTTEVTPLVQVETGDYLMWMSNPVPASPSNTKIIYSGWGLGYTTWAPALATLMYVSYANIPCNPLRMRLIIDDPKQYVRDTYRQGVRDIATWLRAHSGRMVTAWNPQGVDYDTEPSMTGVNADLADAYGENGDVFPFALHDHRGLGAAGFADDSGLCAVHQLTLTDDETVKARLLVECATCEDQIGNDAAVWIHGDGVVVLAENRCSLDGVRIAAAMGAQQMRSCCVQLADDTYSPPAGYPTNHGGGVFGAPDSGTDKVRQSHFESTIRILSGNNKAGSSGESDGLDWWRWYTTTYADARRNAMVAMESVLTEVGNKAVREISLWGHGINTVASRHGAVALKTNPGNGTTITIGETTLTVGTTFALGGTVAATAENLRAYLATQGYNMPANVKVTDDSYYLVSMRLLDAGDDITITTDISDALVFDIEERCPWLDFLQTQVQPLLDAAPNAIVAA